MLGWSLLVVVVGGFGTVSHWVLDTSVFHHMASAPGVAPDWEANGIMTAIGLVAALAYGVRLIADAGVGLHGLIWASPLGWVEELRPLISPRPVALVPIVAFTATLAAVAVRIAGARDAGASIVADRDRRPARLGLLSGPGTMAVRSLRAAVVGWWIALGLSAFLYGVIARSAGATISGSVHEVFSRLGANGTGARAVLGLCFLLEAILIGFVAAGQVTAARAEESDGVLDNVLVRPVSRSMWLGGRLVVALLVLVSCGVVAGVSGWLGAAGQHTGLSLPSLLGAGVNLVPPAIVVLGLGVLTFGTAPRATPVVVYTRGSRLPATGPAGSVTERRGRRRAPQTGRSRGGRSRSRI